MAKIIIKLGQQVTANATADEYIIDDTTATLTRPSQTFTVRTPVGNAGTIKIAVGQAPVAGNADVPANTSITLHGVENGVKNIFITGSDAAQAFSIF